MLLIFEPGSDEYLVRQMVQIINPSPCLAQCLQAAGDASAALGFKPRYDDWAYLDGVIPDRYVGAGALEHRPKLLGLPGVANVAIWGERDQQLRCRSIPKY